MRFKGFKINEISLFLMKTMNTLQNDLSDITFPLLYKRKRGKNDYL